VNTSSFYVECQVVYSVLITIVFLQSKHDAPWALSFCTHSAAREREE